MSNQSTEYQKKFDFYLLALVFTILGLTIQTSNFSLFYCQYIFELSGWVALLISGLAGLSKMEWIPVIIKHMEENQIDAEHKSGLSKARETGAVDSKTGLPMPKEEVEVFLETVEDRINTRTKVINKIEKKHNIKYHFHKWGFIIGLALLLVSRAIYHIQNLKN